MEHGGRQEDSAAVQVRRPAKEREEGVCAANVCESRLEKKGLGCFFTRGLSYTGMHHSLSLPAAFPWPPSSKNWALAAHASWLAYVGEGMLQCSLPAPLHPDDCFARVRNLLLRGQPFNPAKHDVHAQTSHWHNLRIHMRQLFTELPALNSKQELVQTTSSLCCGCQQAESELLLRHVTKPCPPASCCKCQHFDFACGLLSGCMAWCRSDE